MLSVPPPLPVSAQVPKPRAQFEPEPPNVPLLSPRGTKYSIALPPRDGSSMVEPTGVVLLSPETATPVMVAAVAGATSPAGITTAAIDPSRPNNVICEYPLCHELTK